MPGPAPKLKSQRASRKVPRNGEWIELPLDPFAGSRPDLKGLPLEGPACAFAKKAWDLWWASPMAHQWAESEWPMLLRLFVLTDRWYKLERRGAVRDALACAKEMASLEFKLGLTEEGRMKLRWLIPTEDETPVKSGRTRGSSTSAEMRKRLSVVDGAG